MTQSIDKKFRMMPGSDTGNTYLLIGRKGNMAVGIKPETFKSGGDFGSPGNTWFGAKLRVAPGGTILASEEKTVVTMKDKIVYEKPADAFPTIKWSKSDPTRASTVLGILLKGDIAGGSEGMLAFVDHLTTGKLSSKVATYMIDLIGGENLLIDRQDIVDWFDSQFIPVANQMKKKMAVHEEFVSQLEIGNFGIHVDMLKKAYEKVSGNNKTSPASTAQPDDNVDDSDLPDDLDDDGGFN